MNNPISTPLVSILVPLYNHSRYIRRCLDSILEDGYPHREIIIIDDGSKDDSVAVARQWYEQQAPQQIERFVLDSRPNKGVTRTFNELVSKAQGEYLILLASDDYLLPGGIGARIEYLQQHPSKLAVFGDCIVVDENGTKTHNSGIVDLHGGHIECLKNDKLIALELIYNWCIPGPGFMARRSLYEQIGPYDEKLTVEDWDMYLRISASGLLGFIPNPVAAYRFLHGSNSCLNENTKTVHLDSLMHTAWKNSWVFRGLERYGLLYRYFKLKKFKALQQGNAILKVFSNMMCELLYSVSVRRYKKIVTGLD
jgi:glycosyltransferase involved in cell wall biosynthesis